jgi:hypothetical protein
MSIGTAMVIIAIGVFFYLKPEVFKVFVKWSGILLGIAAVGAGGYFGYQHWQETRPKVDLATAKPVYPDPPQNPAAGQDVPIDDLPSFSAPCKTGGTTCNPWERDWTNRTALIGYTIDQNGAYHNQDGSLMSEGQWETALGKQYLSQGFCKRSGNEFDEFDEQPKFTFKCSNDKTYDVAGPKGSTVEQAIVKLVTQNPWLPDPIIETAAKKVAAH